MGEIVEKYFLVLLVLTQSLAESTVRENTGRDEDHLCLGGWLLMIFLDVSQQSSHQYCRLFPVEILVLPDVDEVDSHLADLLLRTEVEVEQDDL